MKFREYYVNEGKMNLEESSDVYKLANANPKLRGLVSKVSMAADYNIDDVYSFILHLLEDVNAHQMMAKIEKIFNKDIQD
jgi:hypothetical protein